jgi:hypothetical protein
MTSQGMNRNDFVLLAFSIGSLSALVLVAFAPVADEATFTMRVWAAAGSPISIAVISTFIAAFAGTWGAQILAERTADRKAVLSEIRGTNAALGLVFTITNTYITTKKQQVVGLVQDYEAQVAARRAHMTSVKAGTPFAYRLELQTIAPPFSPIDELRQMLRERITPDGRALILLTPLVQSIHGFVQTATERNAWIAQVQAMTDNNDSDAKKAALFFGVPYAVGRTDDRYPGYIRGLNLQTDDCIAFSILVGQSLISYGERLAKRYGNGAPKIPKPSFDKAAELLPDLSLYSDWVNN